MNAPSAPTLKSKAEEMKWTADEVVTMLRFIEVPDPKIERMIEMMDFIGLIRERSQA